MSRKTTNPINRRHMSSIAQPPEIADMLRLRGSDKVYSCYYEAKRGDAL